MASIKRPWLLALLLGLSTVLTAGCNLGSVAYYLFGDSDPKLSPSEDMELKTIDKKKDAKVLLLVHCGMELTPEFVTVERELSGLVGRELQKGCKENDQKIAVIPPNKVQQFKNDHPGWASMPPREIGERFDADYVIVLELQAISLFEQGTYNQLYCGRADVGITFVNMHKTDDDPIQTYSHYQYPKGAPIPAGDRNEREFYLAFMNKLAQHLSWNFTAHEFKHDLCDE